MGSTESSQRHELQRADRGQDLWTAVEGAQYARLVQHDEAGDEAEAQAMSDLLDLFSDCAERWEEMSPSDQALSLEQLGCRLDALTALDLFVHWGVLRGRLAAAEDTTVEVPIVVLTIARCGDPAIEIELPTAISAEA